MSIKDNPNRVARTKDSVIAFIGHKLETDGDILIECFVDAQSNEVSFKARTKSRYGKDFVEANEDVQPLIDFTNKLIEEQKIAANVPTEEILDENVVVSPVSNEPIGFDTRPIWEKKGFKTEEEWLEAKRK